MSENKCEVNQHTQHLLTSEEVAGTTEKKKQTNHIHTHTPLKGSG